MIVVDGFEFSSEVWARDTVARKKIMRVFIYSLYTLIHKIFQDRLL